MSLLEVRDLTVRDSLTGALIVRDVHFCLEPGTCLGVVGESGSGKSLTCLALLGLAPPSLRVSGSVRFGGIDLLQAGRETVRGIRGKRIAMIVQQPMTAFDPLYSMGAQLLETLRATTSAFSEKESRGRIVEALEMMHIHNPLDVLKKYPYQLSGGMLQRCMIAVALLQRPDIIIADEPTTALDVTIQAQVLELMANLKQQLNTSMILITHDLGVVAQVCDKVAIMYAGEIVEYGDLSDIYDHASHPYTQGLFGSIPDLDRDTERLNPIAGLMPDPTALPEGCSFSPRCPHCTQACGQQDPGLTEISPGHQVKCLLFQREEG